jgi:methionyl-tRNA formyltransferase
LPEWRGADPIAFAILSGQSKTGVSLMLIDAGMDTGKILVQKSLPIEATDTISSLTEKLIVLSNGLLAENLPRYFSGELRHARSLTLTEPLIRASLLKKTA